MAKVFCWLLSFDSLHAKGKGPFLQCQATSSSMVGAMVFYIIIVVFFFPLVNLLERFCCQKHPLAQLVEVSANFPGIRGKTI